MRKRRGFFWSASLAFLIVVAVAAGVNAALVFGEAFAYAPPEIEAELFEMASQKNQYDITASLDLDSMTLSGFVDVVYRNASDDLLSEVYFHLYPNAYRTEEYAPFAVEEMYLAYPNGFSVGGIDIFEVSLAGAPADYSLEGEQAELLRVDLPDELVPGGSVSIRIAYSVIIPNSSGRFGYGDLSVNLMNCYPVAAMYDEDGWFLEGYWHVGDPFYSDVANYHAIITIPANYTLAATGRIKSRIVDAYESSGAAPSAEGVSIYEIEGPMMRDFAFIVSDQYIVANERVGNTEVYSYHKSKASGEAALEAACAALGAYNGMFGEYPYPTFSVCEADFYIGGMEYPTLVMIGSDLYGKNRRDYLEMVVAHETAHQWFYGIVGNNEIEHPWLDEALTEYATILYYGEQYGEAKEQSAYERWVLSDAQRTLREALPIESPSTAFSNNSSYSQVVYSRGSVMLNELREELGRDRYIAAMSHYVDNNRFEIADPEDFFEAIKVSTGRNFTGFLEDYLTVVD